MKNRPENGKTRRKMWTLKEERFVEKHYGKLPTKDIAQKLGRTLFAVRIRVHTLSLGKTRAIVWSEEEIAIIQMHFLAGTRVPLAKLKALLPERSYKAIVAKITRMNIATPRDWSTAEYKILEQYYPILGSAVVEKLPGRTKRSINLKARKSGVKYVGGERSKRWSDEEKQLLKTHFHLSAKVLQQSFFPDRSIGSVKNAKLYLKNRQKI